MARCLCGAHGSVVASRKVLNDKGLINRKYSQPKKLNFQKINDPMKKWANELNRDFSKEEV
jgi:hypothetical protein